MMQVNQDARTVSGFGEEWSHFDQSALTDVELKTIFDSYFRVFPWESLPDGAIGFDLGWSGGRCGVWRRDGRE